MRKLSYLIASFVFLALCLPAFAAEKTKIRVSGQPALHGMPTWENIRNGSLEKDGLEVKFQIFPSGSAQMEALAAGQWDVGTVGTIPAMLSSMRYGGLIIGIYSDDSETNDVWVRPDSPMLKTKGFNPKYPEIYGTPEDWRGKKILCTTMSNGHYMLSSTLKALGLTDKDVDIVQIEQGQAMAAFGAGEGDIVQLWAPGSYVAEDKGWKRVSSGGSAGVVIPGAIMVNKDFAKSNPEAVVEWLDRYMQVVESLPKDQVKSIDMIHTYFNDYCGLSLTKEQIAKDFSRRRLLMLDQQIDALTDPAKMQSWMTYVAQFMADGKRISAKELTRYTENNCYIDPSFMQKVAEKRAKKNQAQK